MNVRARAIREIYPLGKRDQEKPASNLVQDSKPLSCLELISLAEKYDVLLEQALPYFVELVVRKEPLTEAEIARSPVLTVHRLARAREEARASRGLFDSRITKKIVGDIWPAGKI